MSNLENYAICLCALAELKSDITIAQKAIDHFEKILKFKPDDNDLNHNYKEAISIRNSLDNNISTIKSI